MESSVAIPRITHEMIYDLFREAEKGPFRIKNADPFLFSQDMSKFAVHLRANGDLLEVGKISLFTTELMMVSSIPQMGQSGHDRLTAIIPALCKTIQAAAKRQEHRRTLLEEDVLAIMGPRDQNKKIGVLRTQPREGMILATFADYFHNALPRGMQVSDVDIKPLNNFTATVKLFGDKEASVEAFTLRYMGNRLETACGQDTKARVAFVDSLFDSMRARRDRVLSDPDLAPALQALIEKAGERGITAQGAPHMRDGMAKSFSFQSHSSGVHGIRNMATYGTFKPLAIALGHDVVAYIAVKGQSPAIAGLSFKGEPIATRAGFLPGIENPAAVYGAMKALVVSERPDLFPKVAERLNIPQADDRTLIHALETPEDISDAPLLDL